MNHFANPSSQTNSSAGELRAQWRNPNDIFTILLLVGGDVVKAALAQLCGSWLVPVPFSFGWVTYAVGASLSALGENKLMPSTPDCSIVAINTQSGYVRANKSWVLGRLVRDFDYWKDADIERRERQAIEEMKFSGIPPHEARIGLRLSIYRASSTKTAGRPDRDFIWWSGLLITLTQLGIAAIPYGLYGEWTVLYITGAGTLLGYGFGALPQWAEEKWACRRDTWKTVALTEGNGFKNCIVIEGAGVGLDLEDLAASRRLAKATTRVSSSLLAISWIILLICVAGFNLHTWYLVGLSTLGMLYNIAVAGLPRTSSAFGIHLIYRETLLDKRVMDCLATAETAHPSLGSSLLPTFFPGRLWPREELWWAYAVRRAVAHRNALPKDLNAVPAYLPPLRSDEHVPNDGLL